MSNILSLPLQQRGAPQLRYGASTTTTALHLPQVQACALLTPSSLLPAPSTLNLVAEVVGGGGGERGGLLCLPEAQRGVSSLEPLADSGNQEVTLYI